MNNNDFNAIGIVEISFYTNALIVLDDMLKASDVRLIHWEKKLGGRLVSIIIGGETSAVQSAIDVAQRAGDKVGEKNIKIAITIPSPHPQIIKLINKTVQAKKQQENTKQETTRLIQPEDNTQQQTKQKTKQRRKKSESSRDD